MEFRRLHVFLLTILGTACCLYAIYRYAYNLPVIINRESIPEPASKLKDQSSGADNTSKWTPAKIAEELAFIPYYVTHLCDNIFPPNASVPNKILSEIAKLDDKLKLINPQACVGDGYKTSLRIKALMAIRLTELPFVSTICNMGFNAGHSALMYLLVKPEIKVYSFSIVQHNYTKPMAQYIAAMFPYDRFDIEYGDSPRFLHRFKAMHPHVTCDLISIDSGLTEAGATAEFNNLKRLASCENIILFHGYPSPSFPLVHVPLMSVWHAKTRNMEISALLQCQTRGFFGFSLGRFILNRCEGEVKENPFGQIGH